MRKILLVLLIMMAQGVFAEQGLVVYSDSSKPVSRLFNDSFGSVVNTSLDMIQEDIGWITGKSNHERDEFVFGFVDSNNDLSVQVFNGSWSGMYNFTIDMDNSDRRGFDIAVEDVSGDVLVVYENSSDDDNFVVLRIWNGVDFSSEQRIDNVEGIAHWVHAIAKKGSDEILIIIMDKDKDIFATVWNGVEIVNSTKFNVTFAGQTFARLSFDGAWESLSGEGLVVYSEANRALARTIINNSWSSPFEFLNWSNGNPEQSVLCSDDVSDRIGWMGVDDQDDLNVRMWNGSSVEFLPSPPAEEPSVENTVSSAQHASCLWADGRAVFSFVDASDDDKISFVTYNGSWSNVSLESPSRSQIIDSEGTAIKNLRLAVSPDERIMALTMKSGNNQLTMAELNASVWLPVKLGSVCEQGGNPTSCADFVWNEYDAVPAVVLENNSLNLFSGQNVEIRANVSDENLDVVLMNVTLPNGSNELVFLSNNSQLFLMNFSYVVPGNYSVQVVANDSSSHHNVNASEVVLVKVVNGNPVVQNMSVVASAVQDDIVTVQVNASDLFAIDSVILELILPNSSQKIFSMKNNSRDIFVISITDTSLTGRYVIRVVANNSFGAIGDVNASFFITDKIVEVNRRRAFEQRVAPQVVRAPSVVSTVTLESDSAPIEIDTFFEGVSDQTIEVVKGERESFNIFVNHSYENASLENVSLVFNGRTAEFMVFSPNVIDKVENGVSSFLVSILVPFEYPDSFDTVEVEIRGVLAKRVRNVVDGRVVWEVILQNASMTEVVQLLITSPSVSEPVRMTYFPSKKRDWGWLIVIIVLIIGVLLLRKNVMQSLKSLMNGIIRERSKMKKKKLLVDALKEVYGSIGNKNDRVDGEKEALEEYPEVGGKRRNLNQFENKKIEMMKASEFYRSKFPKRSAKR